MKAYRLRPSLKVIDEDKEWVLESTENNNEWQEVARGTYEEMKALFHKHKKDQKEAQDE